MWIYIILAVLAAAIVLYLVLIAPSSSKGIKEYRGVRFAHRGLHGNGRAENSMSAFRAAVEAGYGIELDVRLSKDGELVVFHDDTLTRVAKIEGRVDEFTADELATFKLSDTEDTVPRFSDVLRLVDGRVPLLVEIKEDAGKKDVSTKAAEMLREYKGKFIVESFNPLSLGNFHKYCPDVALGVLSMNYFKEEKYRKPLYFILKHLLINRAAHPSFIAYCHTDRSPSLWILRHVFGVTTFAWTVRSPEEEKKALEAGFDGVIFEE